MKIKVNGKEQVFNQPSLSVAQLLNESRVENPQMVSVQLNGEFLDKSKIDATYLKDNDEVDFLYFMGGGSAKFLV